LVSPRDVQGRVDWFRQARGDLGRRLQKAFRRGFREKDGPVVVIGSDLPQLTPRLLRRAFLALRRVPAVFGPSADGGYYLVGLSRPADGLFSRIAWSTTAVFAQTVQRLFRARIPFRCLPMRRDLDTPDDVRRLRRVGSCGIHATHFAKTRALIEEIEC
jgi:rSAM/selenodomain-associated transferase 1